MRVHYMDEDIDVIKMLVGHYGKKGFFVIERLYYRKRSYIPVGCQV